MQKAQPQKPKQNHERTVKFDGLHIIYWRNIFKINDPSPEQGTNLPLLRKAFDILIKTWNDDAPNNNNIDIQINRDRNSRIKQIIKI